MHCLQTFSFFTQNGRQSPMGEWQVTPFFRSGPRIAISTSGNLGRFLQKFHYRPTENLDKKPTLEVFGRKKRQAPASAPPTALRSRGNCLFFFSGICKGFLLVSLCPLCRCRRCQPSHIRGRGQPQDTKSPGLHEVGAHSCVSIVN